MPDQLYRKFRDDLEAVPKTSENLKRMGSILLDALNEHGIRREGAVEEIERERQKILGELDAASRSPEQAEDAKASLRAVGRSAWESGVPEAILAFAMTWKLLHGITTADEEAKREYRL